jgi:hypothetical protein
VLCQAVTEFSGASEETDQVSDEGKVHVEMKKIQILTFALVAVFAGIAFAASSAFAISEFLVSGAVITAPVEINDESVGTILLEDEATLGGKSAILCEEVLTLGTVGEIVGGVFNPKLDTVTSVEFMKGCVIDSRPCMELEVPNGVLAVNLPWLTEIALSGSAFVDLILGTAGQPGYLIECETILGLVEDVCTTEAGTTTITNEAEDIDATFPASPLEIEKAGCTLGNAHSGVVGGVSLILTESGLSLAVS